MSWTRATLPALAVGGLLLAGSAGCATAAGPPRGAGESAVPVSARPVGEVLENTDDDGRHYREVAASGAPKVGVEVEPDAAGGWDVRLTLRDFRFSPAGATEHAVRGRGTARLFVDDRSVADLRDPSYRIPAGYLPHGTHRVTARLYADDGTVWAVGGRPVESTANVTSSRRGPSGKAEAGGAEAGEPSGAGASR